MLSVPGFINFNINLKTVVAIACFMEFSYRHYKNVILPPPIISWNTNDNLITIFAWNLHLTTEYWEDKSIIKWKLTRSLVCVVHFVPHVEKVCTYLLHFPIMIDFKYFNINGILIWPVVINWDFYLVFFNELKHVTNIHPYCMYTIHRSVSCSLRGGSGGTKE